MLLLLQLLILMQVATLLLPPPLPLLLLPLLSTLNLFQTLGSYLSLTLRMHFFVATSTCGSLKSQKILNCNNETLPQCYW